LNADQIYSKQNPQVKLVRSLFTRKGRRREGLAPIEGLHAVAEALDAGTHITRVYVVSEWVIDAEGGPELLERLRNSGTPVVSVSPELAGDISGTEAPQGITALVPLSYATLEEVLHAPGTVAVALAGVSDPGNLGTIIRSAECLGARGLVVLPGTVDAYNPKVLRSTVGALFRVPLARATAGELFEGARDHGFRVLVAAPGASQASWEVDWSLPTILVIGNEAHGVPGTVLRDADNAVSIPMSGSMDSLNAAMACTILLYEAHAHGRREPG